MRKGSVKKHGLYLGILLIVTLIYLSSIISVSEIRHNAHYTNDVRFIAANMLQAVFEEHTLNLWTPYYYSGQPLFAQPEYFFLDIMFFVLLLTKNAIIAMNIATLAYFFLAGAGMYFLFLFFKDHKPAALIAALVYMLNGYMHSFVITGNLNVLAGYALIPFTFYFFVKALTTKNYLDNSIYTGIILALQLFAGATLFFTYELILFAAYTIIYLIGKNIKNKIIKLGIVGIVAGIVAAGLSAIRLLPSIEFLGLSNRASGVSYQQYLGNPIDISNFFYLLISNLGTTKTFTAFIGFTALILVLASFKQWNKKVILFSIALLIIGFLISVEGWLSQLLYSFPIFNQLRHIERGLLLFSIGSALMAGMGVPILIEAIKKKMPGIKPMMITVGIVILILVELLFIQTFPASIEPVKAADIPLNQPLIQDSEYFRTINLGMKTLIGASGYHYMSEIGKGTLKGGSGIWFNDYIAYLSVAQQTDPAKLWGILNNKYIISDTELDMTNLELVDTYEACPTCQYPEAFGPYLYRNNLTLPRAFTINNAILLFGTKESATQLGYQLLLDDRFDPGSAVLLHNEKNLEDIPQKELKDIRAVILTSQPSNSDLQQLQAYQQQGGVIVPDIFNGVSGLREEDIAQILSTPQTLKEVPIKYYGLNKVTYDTSQATGFLVMSERFAQFPGWNVLEKKDKKLYHADTIISAIHLEGEQEISLKYDPKEYKKGKVISLLALSILVMFFIGRNFMKKGDSHKA